MAQGQEFPRGNLDVTTLFGRVKEVSHVNPHHSLPVGHQASGQSWTFLLYLQSSECRSSCRSRRWSPQKTMICSPHCAPADAIGSLPLCRQGCLFHTPASLKACCSVPLALYLLGTTDTVSYCVSLTSCLATTPGDCCSCWISYSNPFHPKPSHLATCAVARQCRFSSRVTDACDGL